MTKVTLANKEYVDQQDGELAARLDAIGAPVDASGLVTTQQLNTATATVASNASSDATTKANAAQTNAAADATAKADAAEAAAIADATAALDAHKTSPTAHGLDIGNVATKAYVDAATAGTTSYPQACDIATTGNHSLSGLSAVDGVTPTGSMRVLVWMQTNPAENGVYTPASGAWTRTTDFDADSDIKNGAILFVAGGTLYAGYQFVLDAPEPQNVGTDPLNFRPYQRPEQTSAAAPLVKTGNQFSITAGGITDSLIATANKDGVAGTPSLRTLGTGAQQAAAGNDSRLSNARTPTTHAATHASNGSDPINPTQLGIAAGNVSFTPVSGISSTNVQNAIAQVQTNLSSLPNAGGVMHFVSMNSSGSAVFGDVIEGDATSGPITVTLPTPSNDSRPVTVVKVDSSSNPVIVNATSGLINGTSTLQLAIPFESRMFASSASAWRIVGGFVPPALFARLDQDNDFQGHSITNFTGVVKTVPGSSYTPILSDSGKTLVFSNTGGASTITVTLPNSFGTGTSEWAADFQVDGAATGGGLTQLLFVVQSGGSLVNPDGQTKSAKRYAPTTARTKGNTTGTNTAWQLDGYTGA